MCFGCSKESSHQDDSFEYPQHMFWLRNKKNNFQLGTLVLRSGNFLAKPLKLPVLPAKPWISLGIGPVLSVFAVGMKLEVWPRGYKTFFHVQLH